MKIGILNGYWSTNIGNAFFQLGAKFAIDEALPGSRVITVPDFAGYARPNFYLSNAFDAVTLYDIDVLVVLGPIFRKETAQHLLRKIKNLRNINKDLKIVSLSAGFMHYDLDESFLEELITELELDLIITRDTDSYNKLVQFHGNVHLGIDTAFYISDVYPKDNYRFSEKSLALTFDQYNEPKPNSGPKTSNDVRLQLGDQIITLGSNSFVKENIILNALKRINASFHPKDPWNILLPDWNIIRLDHRFNPYFGRKIYSRPNTSSLDVPEAFLSVYGSSGYTISNRVHACAAALAYGNKAYLASKNLRGGLLERVGASSIRDEFVDGSLLPLSELKAEFTDQLSKAFSVI